MKIATRKMIIAAFGLMGAAATASADDARPNIVWIVVDDMSANFSCYGETTVETPNVDRLARDGTMFRKAFVTAPVCSASRSALITGMYQTTIGAQNHRSGRGAEKIHLPSGVEPVPAIFKRNGYYTAIGGPLAKGKALAKTDYNFEWDPAIYDGNDWSGRKPGQPFFMQVQLHGGKYREGKNWTGIASRELGTATQSERLKLPPYYPRDPVLLEDWARYLDAVRYTDKQVGDVLARLEAEKVLDRTIVFFMTDHGVSHARGKQFLYDEGTHVPLVVAGPGIAKGNVRDDLVEHISLASTSLALAGIPIPEMMQGRDLFAKSYAPVEAVFAARDRCDETVDRIRSVRTDRFKYIRNGYPDRPLLQPNRYKDAKKIIQRIRTLHDAGRLDSLQERVLFSPTRPKEELYDLRTDPFELNNLANGPAFRKAVDEMSGRLDRWIAETGDRGQAAEPDSMYDSDMKAYLGSKNDEQNKTLRDNIATMKKWAVEGK